MLIRDNKKSNKSFYSHKVLYYCGDYMPKVLDIIEVKRVIEEKFKQLYPESQYIEIHRANQYPSLGIWSVISKISSDGKVRTYSLNIEIETGNVKAFNEII